MGHSHVLCTMYPKKYREYWLKKAKEMLRELDAAKTKKGKRL